MKILHIIPTLKRAGAESQVVSLSNELKKERSIEVSIFTFSKENDFNKELDIGIKLYKGYGFSPLGMLLNLIFIIYLIKKYNFTVIHSHMYHSILISRIISIFHSAKNIETFHCSVDNIRNSQRLLLKLTRNMSDYTSFVSSKTMTYLIDRNMISIGGYIPNMVDRKYFTYSEKSSIQSNKWISVGRLVEEKNQRLLIESCSLLSKAGIEYSLDVYGDGYLKEELNSLIKVNKLEDKVFLKGSCQNMEEIYKDYNFYISTSSIESFGIVYLEAMSQRLLILSTVNEGAEELLVKNKIGYIAKHEPKDIASKMAIIMESKPEEINTETNNGFNVLTKNYHPESVTNKWIEIYKRA